MREISKLLNSLKENIQDRKGLEKKFTDSKGESNGFERLVLEELEKLQCSSIINHSFSFQYEAKFKKHFPDIDIFINNIKYGIEVKSRQKDKNSSIWTTNGNSVIESITSQGYKEIYIFFGVCDNLTKSYEVRFDYYWKVISDIKVTHSPRFSINMNISTEDQVFKSHDEYQKLRECTESDKVDFIRTYLQHNTVGNKWYTSNGLQEDIRVSPLPLKLLDKNKRDLIISEVMIIYAHSLISSSKANYDEIAEYLIEEYFVFSSSLRDIFSAGGKHIIKEQEFPKIIKKYQENLYKIEYILKLNNEDLVKRISQIWTKNSNYIYDRNLPLRTNFIHYLNDIGKNQLSSILQGKHLSYFLGLSI